MPFNLTFGRLPNNGDAFGTVFSVNGKTGNVNLTAADVDAATEKYVDEKIAELPTAPVLSVNGEIGEVRLDAIKVNAEPLGAVQQAKDEIQPQIESLSGNKLDKVDYVQHFLGVFASKAALDAAHPTARPGDSADIDSGSGFDVMRAIWDDSDHKWVVREVNNAQNTDQVSEGNTNLYFKAERVLSTLLAGFNPINTAISAADTVVQGLSKAQGQISNIINTFAANVRGTQLNGLNITNSSDVGAGDSVLTGIGKLQAKFGILNNTVRAVDLYFLDVNQTAPVNAFDTILSAFGKLQGQLNASNAIPMVWVNAATLTGITWGSLVDTSKTKLEFSKYQGLIYFRGYITTTSPIGSGGGGALFTHKDSRYMCDVSFSTNPLASFNLANLFATTFGQPAGQLTISQGALSGDMQNIQSTGSLATGVYHLAPIMVGKAKS